MPTRNGAHMKIGSISNNTNFGRVYQVIGHKKDMQELRLLVAEEKKNTNNPAMVYNLTTHSSVPQSIKDKLEDKQLCVIVTGEESLKKTSRLTGNKLSYFLLNSAETIVKISSDVKRDAMDILHSIKLNN